MEWEKIITARSQPSENMLGNLTTRISFQELYCWWDISVNNDIDKIIKIYIFCKFEKNKLWMMLIRFFDINKRWQSFFKFYTMVIQVTAIAQSVAVLDRHYNKTCLGKGTTGHINKIKVPRLHCIRMFSVTKEKQFEYCQP